MHLWSDAIFQNKYSTMKKWIDVPGYEGKYQFNIDGEVRSLTRVTKSCIRHNPTIIRKGKPMKIQTNPSGYKSVCLYKDGVPKLHMIHRLIAGYYIPNPNNLPFINHIDANPSNNSLDNLEWCTQSHNIQHAYNIGRKFGPKTNLGRIGILSNKFKKVIQCDINGNAIKEWDCIRDVQRKHGFNGPNISKVLKGKIHSAYGYKWKYA